VNISEFQEGQEVTSYYLLRSFQRKTASNQKVYYHLVLGDRTGSIDGRLFSVSDLFGSPEEYQPGSVVKIRGVVESFNKKLNLKLIRVRLAKEEESEDYLPRLIRRSVRPPGEIRTDVRNAIEELASAYPLEGNLCRIIFDAVAPVKIERAAAAAKLHHAYLGGFLEHVLSLIEAAQIVSPHYGLDYGTMTALAFLHDIGKLSELSEDNGVFDYTREGVLFGHIPMGYALVQSWCSFAKKCAMEEGVSSDEADYRIEAILHGILSHHGEIAFGSPIVPATREAIAFHYLDNLDSKMQIEAEAWESVPRDTLIHPERHYKLGTRLVRYPHSIRLRQQPEEAENENVNDGEGK